MNGKPPFEKLSCSGCDLPQNFVLFPPIIFDTISTDWVLQTVTIYWTITYLIGFAGVRPERSRARRKKIVLLPSLYTEPQGHAPRARIYSLVLVVY